MVYGLLVLIITFIQDIITSLGDSNRNKDMEIIILRQRLHQVLLIFKPETVLRWHRELVRRKWTFSRKAKPDRPTISSELVILFLRLANEIPRWGYDKIHGELLKPGHRLSATSVRNILKRHRITPAFGRSSRS